MSPEARQDAVDDERAVCVALIASRVRADELPLAVRWDMFAVSVYGVIVEAFREVTNGHDLSSVGLECIRRGYSDGPETIAELWPIPGIDLIPSAAEAIAACLRIHASWQARTLAKGLREAAELAASGVLPINVIAERVRYAFSEVRK
jgi:hypothetical protein